LACQLILLSHLIVIMLHPARILTIAIPTFDRNQTLNLGLSKLLPQLTPDCELLIVDNCSLIPIEFTLQSLLSEYPSLAVRLVRNGANIGGSANVCRCFELCDTEWVWILGDDDHVSEGRIQIILETIRSHPDVLGINFAISRICRKTNTLANGLREFIFQIDDFSNLLFLSGNIFRASKLKPFVKYGYHATYSMAPHLVMLLRALSETNQFYFTKQLLVEHSPPNNDQQYPILQAALGMGLLTDSYLPEDCRRRLLTCIYSTYPVHTMALHGLLHLSLVNHNRAAYLFGILKSRIFFSGQGIRLKAIFAFYSICFKLPVAIRKAVLTAYDGLKGNQGMHYCQDDSGKRL
jgi:glycosyltransferase involved in cell wall biosynthesis